MFIWHGVESRNGSQNTAARSGLDAGGSGLDGCPVSLAHARHDIAGRSAVHSSHNSVPILLGDACGVYREAEDIARVRNDAVDNGVLLVCVGPVVNSDTSRRLARDGNLAGVAAELLDVVSNPLDGRSLVAETEILRLAWSAREAENVESVVDRNDDNIFAVGKVFA